MPINGTGRSREKGHRDKHGGEYERNTDQRPGNLTHGFTSGFARGQSVFRHDPLHILHNHNRVIDKEADRQHHPKHRQSIYGIAKGCQNPECTEEHDWHRNGRNKSCPQILKKQEHDKKHEDNRLKQSFDNLFN